MTNQQGDEPRLTGNEGTGENSPKLNRKWVAIALGVVVFLLVIGAVTYKSATTVDETKVDTALSRLALATRGTKLNKQVADLTKSNLAKPSAVQRAKNLDGRLTDLKEDSSKAGDAGDMVEAVSETTTALRSVAKETSGIQKSKMLTRSSVKKDVPRLVADRKFLAGSIASFSIGKLLNASLSLIQDQINESLDDLKEEDRLPDPDADGADPQVALRQLDDLKKEVLGVDSFAKKQVKRVIGDSNLETPVSA